MDRRLVPKTSAPQGWPFESAALCQLRMRGRIRMAAPVCKTGSPKETLQVQILSHAPVPEWSNGKGASFRPKRFCGFESHLGHQQFDVM